MVQTLNMQHHVTFTEVQSDVFFDYGELLDRFYKAFPGGSIQGNHIFWADASKPSVLYTKETDEAPVITLPFRNDKFVQQQNRLRELKGFALKSIPAPGIKPIKQVELYMKWRKFVPDSFQDEICPKPSTEVINQVTSDRKQKNRERASKKRPRVRGGRGAS
jgi:hypothetical protein